MKYTNGVEDVEAIQFTGHNQARVLAHAFPEISVDALNGAQIMQLPVIVDTENGEVQVLTLDWVTRSSDGRVSTVNPHDFERIYSQL